MTKLDRIFVIGLARRTDRRQRMEDSLRGAEAPVEYFDAVDGATLDPSNREAQGYQLYAGWNLPNSKSLFRARELRTGEIGCALSHVYVWKKVVAQGLERALILEDDAHPVDGFEARFAGIVDALAARGVAWDLIYLGRTPATPDQETRFDDALMVPMFSYCTYAYAVTRRGAERLLAGGLEQAIIPVDEYLPAMYMRHPRADIHAEFGGSERLIAFACKPELVPITDDTQDSDTEASKFVLPPNAVASRLCVSRHAGVEWHDGNVYVTSQTSKDLLELSPEDARVVLQVINEFATASTLDEVCARIDVDRASAQHVVETCLEIGVLVVVGA